MTKKILLFLLMISSFILIFYKFNFIPQYLAFDELEFAKLALSLKDQSYTPYSPLATGHSTLYFYLILFFFNIFGVNNFALRLPSALSGIGSVFVFYLIIKIIFKKEKKLFFRELFPVILAFIFLTLRWFFNFARFAFEAPFLLLLELISIYFLFNYFENKKTFNLFLSGIFSGLAFNSYTPGRLFFVLPLGFLIFNFIKNKKIILLKNILFFIIPLFILTLPLNLYLLKNQDDRIDKLFFWRNHEMTLKEKFDGTIQNINNLFLMLFLKGDINGKHNYPGKPALNPIIFVLFLIGLFYFLKKERKKLFGWFFLGYFFISLAPSIPIYPWENPNMLRTYTLIPSIVFFTGQGIIFLINQFKNKKLLISIIFILVFISSIYEIRTYFKYQSQVFKEAFEIKYPLEKIIYEKNY